VHIDVDHALVRVHARWVALGGAREVPKAA
jgi:hypothetical protein